MFTVSTAVYTSIPPFVTIPMQLGQESFQHAAQCIVYVSISSETFVRIRARSHLFPAVADDLKLYMFQSKILDLLNCNARQVQSVSDKVKTVCIKSKTCPMLRIEISFKVSVHDRFRSNFISSAQVRKPKSNQETCHLQFTTATTKLSIISQCVQSTTNDRNS